MAKPGKHLVVAESPSDLAKKILAYRAAGMSLARACSILDISAPTAKRLLEQFQQEADAARSEDLDVLEELLQISVGLARKDYVMVNAGKIVYREDIDPLTGELRALEPLEDDGPKITAVNAAIKVLDRKAKLMGMDKLPPVAGETGSGDTSPLTPAQEMKAMEVFLARIAQRTAAARSITVESTPVHGPDATETVA